SDENRAEAVAPDPPSLRLGTNRGPGRLHPGQDDAPSDTSELPSPALPRLPVQFTRFFGREDEIARLAELLCRPETRLVTLTGPGGSGKTRLAIAVTGRLEAQFDGAVW